ncbi:MAG: hypothetical protein P9M14_07370 [Candidatus Alcyoniella australis]|nr:hypothetical protein [Candidatus Alcyoniella australis]
MYLMLLRDLDRWRRRNERGVELSDQELIALASYEPTHREHLGHIKLRPEVVTELGDELVGLVRSRLMQELYLELGFN